MKYEDDSIFVDYFDGWDLACAMMILAISIAVVEIAWHLLITYPW